MNVTQTQKVLFEIFVGGFLVASLLWVLWFAAVLLEFAIKLILLFAWLTKELLEFLVYGCVWLYVKVRHVWFKK